jgi:hypothetical protein
MLEARNGAADSSTGDAPPPSKRPKPSHDSSFPCGDDATTAFGGLLQGRGSGAEVTQEAALIQLGLLGPDAPRTAEMAAIEAEFHELTAEGAEGAEGEAGTAARGDGGHLGAAAFARGVAARYWPAGLDVSRLCAACFEAHDYDGSGALTLHEHALFHAAVVRYDHARDARSLELQSLRMRTAVCYFDADKNGTLSASEARVCAGGGSPGTGGCGSADG